MTYFAIICKYYHSKVHNNVYLLLITHSTYLQYHRLIYYTSFPYDTNPMQIAHEHEQLQFNSVL